MPTVSACVVAELIAKAATIICAMRVVCSFMFLLLLLVACLFVWFSAARHLTRTRSATGGARHDGGYRVHQAQERTRARRSRSRRNQRFGPAELSKVEALLREEWSPEQIAGTLRRRGTLCISHETIYRHVWKDKRQGGTLY